MIIVETFIALLTQLLTRHMSVKNESQAIS